MLGDLAQPGEEQLERLLRALARRHVNMAYVVRVEQHCVGVRFRECITRGGSCVLPGPTMQRRCSLMTASPFAVSGISDTPVCAARQRIQRPASASAADAHADLRAHRSTNALAASRLARPTAEAPLGLAVPD